MYGSLHCSQFYYQDVWNYCRLTAAPCPIHVSKLTGTVKYDSASGSDKKWLDYSLFSRVKLVVCTISTIQGKKETQLIAKFHLHLATTSAGACVCTQISHCFAFCLALSFSCTPNVRCIPVHQTWPSLHHSNWTVYKRCLFLSLIWSKRPLLLWSVGNHRE